MADALCGPSNALQNFQKHSSVDRTLQQDRLVSRQSPQQVRALAPPNLRNRHPNLMFDPEFEAFQAGHPPPQPEAFQRFPAQHAPPPNFAGPAALPDWAADFQRMHVSSPPPMQQQQQMQPQHNHTASWHQDFLRQQQQPASPAPQMTAGPSRPMYSGASMMGYGAGQFAHQQPFMAPQNINAQAKQKEPIFDDAAFASAFDAAAAEMLQAETQAQVEAQTMQQAAPQRPAMSKWEEEIETLLPPEDDSVLAFMKEHAFSKYYAAVKSHVLTTIQDEYCRHQMSEYLPRANARDPATVPNHSLASLYLGALEKLESKGLSEMAPDPLLERVLNEILSSQDLLYDEQFMFKARAARLRDQIKTNSPRYFDQDESQKAREQEDPQLRTARLRMFQNSLQNQESISAADKQQIEAAKFNQLVADVGTESRFFPAEASSTMTGTDIRTTIRSEMSSLNQRPEELLRNMNPPEMVLNEVPQPLQQPIWEQQQQQPQQNPLNNDDEELARTAGQLVDSVSHDTSQKFVQSRFLALMRQLRDHEVRVDGDKIVEVSETLPPPWSTAGEILRTQDAPAEEAYQHLHYPPHAEHITCKTTPSTIPANQQDQDLGRNGGDESSRTMTGALQTDGNDGNDLDTNLDINNFPATPFTTTKMPSTRLTVALNSNRNTKSILLVPSNSPADPDAPASIRAQVLKSATTKLRLKLKKNSTARFFAARTGSELLAADDWARAATSDAVILISAGEDFVGNKKPSTASASHDGAPNDEDCTVVNLAHDAYVDQQSLGQLRQTAETLPGIAHAVGQPDLHPGNKYPVGAAFVSRGWVHPPLIGGDIGCGMAWFRTTLSRTQVDGDRGRKVAERLRGLEGAWRGRGEREAWVGHGGSADVEWDKSLGTIGAGNHFAEIQVVERAEEGLGLKEGEVVLLVHSGSRGYGGDILKRYTTDGNRDSLREGDEVTTRYLEEHDRACRWAKANRDLIALRFLAVLEPGEESWVLGSNFEHVDLADEMDAAGLEQLIQQSRENVQKRKVVDIWHNNVQRVPWPLTDPSSSPTPLDSATASLSLSEKEEGPPEQQQQQQYAYIHRKGAAPTLDPDTLAPLAILPLPGSRATPTAILTPTFTSRNSGGTANAFSLAHGAGRAMSRAKAFQSLSNKYRGDAEALLKPGKVAAAAAAAAGMGRMVDQNTDQGGSSEEVVGSDAEKGAGTWVVCEEKQLVWEEAPEAYKDVWAVAGDLVRAGAAEVRGWCAPRVSYKVRSK
ncbi:hypothetical protein SLS58_004188 [Diplodia intermedia]|uniref:3'-phosphate/5'-hydroxy nucleic acid ligase n=1 Tax=Diplodia intermedia TaxID=856260 RepID=A0ABR3TU55_9PEZI